MLIIVVLTALVGSFQAGKYSEKAQVVEDKKVCFDQPYYERKAGCYKVTPPKDNS